MITCDLQHINEEKCYMIQIVRLDINIIRQFRCHVKTKIIIKQI